MTQAPPLETAADAPNLFALVWAVLRRIMALMFTAGADRSLHALMQEAEAELARSLLRLAIQHAGGGIDPDDVDVKLVWTRSGGLDFAIAWKGQRLLERAHLARLRAARHAGPPIRFNRFAQVIHRLERRRHRRHARPASLTRLRTPPAPAPRVAVPP